MSVYRSGHKCHKVTAWLYNDTCWSNLSEHLPARHIRDFLRSRLNHNGFVLRLLNPYLKAPDFYHRFMEDVCAWQNDPAISWHKGEWVCGDCNVQFVKQELYSWFVRRLVQDRHKFKPNCPYGYDCVRQTHRIGHAEQLNHLCDPEINLYGSRVKR
ncbi:hypothetical protein SCHPADRAFT_561418 [Schizopora paradoxa]|uniref:Uncharacterized protein n=1 Tax=Schizopora paradoxa TaxID=27342 RepID=A0A0H2RCK7_9AGAM|nr:hypothetical protein SCHPADRAFT_561418 [Schizopora paradoxa]